MAKTAAKPSDMTPKDRSVGGVISPINFGALRKDGCKNYLGLFRKFVGGAYIVPPLGCLSVAAWEQLDSPDQFELNLNIRASELDKVQIETLGEYTARLRAHRPLPESEPELPEFNGIFSAVLETLGCLLRKTKEASLAAGDPRSAREERFPRLGVLTPNNILIVRWSGWTPEWRIIFADLGFSLRRNARATDREWAASESIAQLYDAPPEVVFSQPMEEAALIRSVARLFTMLAEPDALEGRPGGISAERRPQLHAKVWTVIANALAGRYLEADLEGESPWKRFVTDFDESNPAFHFTMDKETRARSAPRHVATPLKRLPRNRNSQRHRWWLLLAVIFLGLLGGGLYFYGKSRPVCRCCPEVSAYSPLFPRLVEMDQLPTQPPDVDGENEWDLAPLRHAHEAIAQPNYEPTSAELRCLQDLRKKHRDKLHDLVKQIRVLNYADRKERSILLNRQLRELHTWGPEDGELTWAGELRSLNGHANVSVSDQFKSP